MITNFSEYSNSSILLLQKVIPDVQEKIYSCFSKTINGIITISRRNCGGADAIGQHTS
jgi:hypothetical protein